MTWNKTEKPALNFMNQEIPSTSEKRKTKLKSTSEYILTIVSFKTSVTLRI